MKFTSHYRMMPFFEEDGAGSGAATGNDGGNGGAGDKKTSFADVLKDNPEFQSELDRRINQAVETATNKERERMQTVQNEAVEEATRVAKMTQAEKDAYFAKKATETAAKKELELTKRELTLDARTMLADKKMPDAFVALLDYSSKEACEKSIGTLETAFRTAVQDAVNEKLKGGEPPKDARTEGAKSTPESDNEKALKEMAQIMGLKLK